MYLPHELIVQILMRLPVKFLIRFRCVCKLWFSLISHPHFANSHFQLTSATNTHRIVSISTRSDEIPSIDFDAFLNDDPASAILNFSLPESYFPYEIRGSCRGFILLYHHPDIYIWNPCTGFKTQIPVSPFRSKLAAHCRVHIHGFGYDQSRDDYLVVSLSYDPTLANDVSTHLMALRRDLGRKVIIAFDLTERKFFEMPLPSDLGHLSNSSLWVFGEFLSQCARNYDNDTVEIWVMKEYKVHSSWTKTLVLSVDAIADHYFQPIYYTKNGNIIGRNHGTKLMKYDDKGQLLRHRSFSNCPSFYNCPSEVVVYMESLLSLPGDSEQV